MADITPSRASLPWVITQQDPPGRIVRLEGGAAPHGRRRKSPLVKTTFELRKQETYYSGRRPPSRHVFGDKESPITLTGRLMDINLGQGKAIEKRDELKQLVADGVTVLVKWGSVISYLAFPDKLTIGVEDEANFTYELSMSVDSDTDLVRRRGPLPAPAPPAALANVIADLGARATAPFQLINPLADILPDVVNGLSGAVSLLNTASATLLSAAESVDDFEEASVMQLRRLLAGLNQFKTAAIQFQTVFEAIRDEDITFAKDQSDVRLRLAAARAFAEDATIELLALAADMESRLSTVEVSRAFVAIVAKLGDTWESLATQVLGSPGAAQLLRDANDITYGEQPQPGRSYLVPAN